jgi:hypothetical protein
MHRKLTTATLVAALVAASGAAAAQDFVFGWNPRTGDVWVDQTLGDMNAYGYRYRDAFVDELVRYYGAPRDYVTSLLVDGRWAPGDVYYACAIGQVIGRSCRYVAEEWEQDHGQGWGALAQRLGIKPGSEAFHRLKRGFVPTYDHWARPLPLDDALHRAFPDRARGHLPGNAGKARGGRPDVAGQGRGNSDRAHDNRGNGRGADKGPANKGKGNQGNGNNKGKGQQKGNGPQKGKGNHKGNGH